MSSQASSTASSMGERAADVAVSDAVVQKVEASSPRDRRPSAHGVADTPPTAVPILAPDAVPTARANSLRQWADNCHKQMRYMNFLRQLHIKLAMYLHKASSCPAEVDLILQSMAYVASRSLTPLTTTGLDTFNACRVFCAITHSCLGADGAEVAPRLQVELFKMTAQEGWKGTGYEFSTRD
ncbi:Hypothetical predicted protein [Cloeon dipterum]|uniref:Uncharacterized protein n=1 Tax=Cloeon dipterum TaxID=197152 RepID=A0A8S1E791_9INSE|nr:Hypothetical predicted protein [Cloeon dipterum]